MINRIIYFFDACSSMLMYSCIFAVGIFIFLKIKGMYHSIKCKNKQMRYTYKNFVYRDFANFASKTVCTILIVCLIISIIVTLLFSPVIQEVLGFHNLYLESIGKHCYYISLYIYETDEEIVIPAQVTVDIDNYRRQWYITEFYLPNGEHFESDMEDYSGIKPNGNCYAFDDTGRDWADITLLNKPATSNKILTTNKLSIYNTVGLIISLFSQLFVIVTLHLIPGSKEQHNK